MKAHTTLGLAELPDGAACAARWIGPLVALGARAWRSLAQISGKQLIMTVTVPRRDLAAVLVGCGWLMAHPAPALRPPIESLRELARRNAGAHCYRGNYEHIRLPLSR